MDVPCSIIAKVTSSLESTRYACTDLTRLSGGFVNFTYRGRLLTPLPATPPATHVILKHAEPYLATASVVAFTVNRSHYESIILNALNTFPTLEFQNTKVTTPYFHKYSAESNTLVLSDFQDSVQMDEFITKHALSATEVLRLGTALGQWTRHFHEWSLAPEQSALCEAMSGNIEMTKMKHKITYGHLEEAVTLFPTILEESREIFHQLEQRLRSEMEKGDSQLIHGDFKCANFLLPNRPLPAASESLDLCIIDWELAQLSTPAYDLGQLFAELFFLTHFKSVLAGTALISSFMKGYGPLSEEMAFGIAADFGAHLVLWPHRNSGVSEVEVAEACVRIGRDAIVHAEERDKLWFNGGVLHGIFSSD
ncbi:kinase-like domain-containing protein [Dactylonectria estremocensis]|uniref:Kinase-like domain-containing protein n=1 Tax=Dactylonectria estremocensis TaxID=1079267 RepID=A0A9P9FDK1_9HYPO|nr:kinase-like domain-containing protein [Dactylonectria estremocensis]